MSIEAIQDRMVLSEPADLFTGRERGHYVGDERYDGRDIRSLCAQRELTSSP